MSLMDKTAVYFFSFRLCLLKFRTPHANKTHNSWKIYFWVEDTCQFLMLMSGGSFYVTVLEWKSRTLEEVDNTSNATVEINVYHFVQTRAAPNYLHYY